MQRKTLVLVIWKNEGLLPVASLGWVRGWGGGGEGGEERGGEERLVTFSEHPQGSTHSTHAQHAQHAAPRTSRSSRPQPSSFAVRVWQSTHPLLPVLSHGCELVAPACRHGKGRGGSAAEGG